MQRLLVLLQLLSSPTLCFFTQDCSNKVNIIALCCSYPAGAGELPAGGAGEGGEVCGVGGSLPGAKPVQRLPAAAHLSDHAGQISWAQAETNISYFNTDFSRVCSSTVRAHRGGNYSITGSNPNILPKSCLSKIQHLRAEMVASQAYVSSVVVPE